jgi:two-component system chemotaxis response regulator CheY
MTLIGNHAKSGRPVAAGVAAPAVDCGLRILVIDDQQTMRKIMRRLLNIIGIREILEASDGRAALDLLLNPRTPWVDVVICDLMMPGMDGLAFCNSVRRDDSLRQRHLPIMVLTAERDEMLLQVARQVGAVDIANKPISAPELERRIERLVGIKLH